VSIKTSKTEDMMTVNSFPKCIFSLFICLIVLFIFGGIFGEHNMKIVDFSIVTLVLSVGLLIQKSVRLSFSRLDNKLAVTEKRIVGTITREYVLSDIEGFQVVHGRGGGNARGGAIYAKIKGEML